MRACDSEARVVNVASGAGKRPDQLIGPYACLKAAVISLTRSVAATLAPQIPVECVSPGVVEGAMWEGIDACLEELGAPTSARYAALPVGVAASRTGSPAEVAEAIAFLASDAGSHVVGEDLNVDAGQLMR